MRTRLNLLISIILLLFFIVSIPAFSEEKILFINNNFHLTCRAQVFDPGEIVIFEVRQQSQKINNISAAFLDTDLEFYKENSTWYALFGIPTLIEPKVYKINISALTDDGKKSSYEYEIKINKKQFNITPLSVDPYYLEYTPEKLERIRKESRILKELWQKRTPEKYWTGLFLRPVEDVKTLEFGVKREFNGEYRSYHTGIDIRAQENTEIIATNSGRVVLCDDFYFSGKFIVIDHGRGLYSFYAHLNEFKVETGDYVKKGQPIGLSGITGRITGPHLHWTMKLNSVNVNPESLEKLLLY